MSTVTSKDGTKIAFEKTGTGPSLILVDGAFCYRKNGPTPKLTPLLAEHFTVYAYDRRGRGESGNTEPYSMDREIEDLEALLQEAGGEAYVLGMSSGAALALHAAARGLSIKKLALFEPPFTAARNPNPPAPDENIQLLNKLVAENHRSDAVKYFMTKVMGMPGAFVIVMRLMPGIWKKNKSVAHTLSYDLTIIGDATVPAKAATVSVPTVVLGGQKSPDSMRDAYEATAEAIPHADIKRLAGQSHNVSMKVLAPELISFFN